MPSVTRHTIRYGHTVRVPLYAVAARPQWRCCSPCPMQHTCSDRHARWNPYTLLAIRRGRYGGSNQWCNMQDIIMQFSIFFKRNLSKTKPFIQLFAAGAPPGERHTTLLRLVPIHRSPFVVGDTAPATSGATGHHAVFHFL